MIRSASLLSFVVLLASCVSTELELPPNHPANASAQTAPLPEVGRALTANFDALSQDAASTSATPAAHGDDAHAGHSHGDDAHAGHSNAVPSQATPHAEPSAAPANGASPAPSSAEPASATQYTCPMHPEIVRSEPGNCPTCGMKLVPAKPKAQAKP